MNVDEAIERFTGDAGEVVIAEQSMSLSDEAKLLRYLCNQHGYHLPYGMRRVARKGRRKHVYYV